MYMHVSVASDSCVSVDVASQCCFGVHYCHYTCVLAAQHVPTAVASGGFGPSLAGARRRRRICACSARRRCRRVSCRGPCRAPAVVCLFVRSFACLFACLFICLFVCYLVCSFICLVVCLVGWLVACLLACLVVCLFPLRSPPPAPHCSLQEHSTLYPSPWPLRPEYSPSTLPAGPLPGSSTHRPLCTVGAPARPPDHVPPEVQAGGALRVLA